MCCQRRAAQRLIDWSGDTDSLEGFDMRSHTHGGWQWVIVYPLPHRT